ncbi:hypothetical protein NLM59_03030 [Weeksellaceae bacterium KMM 9724]|uniref:glycosyltransferase n=1 Tax=Profundicola chukchiensis TaxID=2961959 RepID=UPI002438ACED|nr:glycosyltransferase [Profundicola chukchiensis]MDG4949887.1 hypothetical protein [Profundicola chukchiensis]
MNNEGKAVENIKKYNKPVINLKTKPSIYSFTTFHKVLKVIKKEKPVLVHTSGAEANFHGIIAAKIAGVKVIIGEEIGIPQHGSQAKFIYSTIYKFANYIVGNSQQVLDVVHEQDNLPFQN